MTKNISADTIFCCLKVKNNIGITSINFNATLSTFLSRYTFNKIVLLRYIILCNHTLQKIIGLCSSKTLHLLFLCRKPVHFSSFFISCMFTFLHYECSGLCQHRPGHSWGKKNTVTWIKKHKKLHGFSCSNCWIILL